jgi:tetratricopeptide (TPR) repeat protein
VGILVMSPAQAGAQKDQFVAAVRELAGAALEAGPTTRQHVQAATDRMSAALAQWDRTIGAVESRITRDLENAPGTRAYNLHLELGVLYLERGRLADAQRQLEMASAADPRAPEPRVLRATALELGGQRDAAGREWQAVWSADRTNPIAAYQMLCTGGGMAADRSAALSSLVSAYRRLLAADEPPRLLSFAAVNVVPDTFSAAPIVGDAATAAAFAHLAEARYDDALAALRREPAATESPLARFARGREYEQANRVHEARLEYQAAVAGALSGRSLLYVGIGRLAQVEGDFDGAVEAFKRAVQLNPNDVNMHRELALAYAAKGAVDDAFTEFTAALLLNPRHAEVFADIGRLFLDAGRDAEALPPLYRALALAPERYEARYAIATGLTRMGRSDDAARELAAFQQAQRDALDRQRKGLDTPSR